MFRHLKNHFLVGFVQTFGVGEDEIRDVVTTVVFGNLAGTVKDDVKGFGMDAHFQIRGVAGEMVQEMINFIH